MARLLPTRAQVYLHFLAAAASARNPPAALVSPKSVVPDYGDVLTGIYTGQIKDWHQALKDLDARKQAAFEDAIKKAQSDGAKVSIQDFIFADWDPMKT